MSLVKTVLARNQLEEVQFKVLFVLMNQIKKCGRCNISGAAIES